MRCIVCGSNDVRIIGKRSDFDGIEVYSGFVPSLEPFDRNIASCGHCGVAFIDPMYTDAEIDELYGDRYSAFIDDHAPVDFPRELVPAWLEQFKVLGVHRWRERFAEAHTRKPRMIDIGCGNGRVLFLFDQMGFDVQGIDLNPKIPELIKKAFGYRVDRLHLSDAAALGQFDAVAISHVIEHLTDLNKSMSDLVGLIAPGGFLFVDTPWADDSGRYDQRYRDIYHTIFFNHLSLMLIGLKHGLVICGANRHHFSNRFGYHKHIQLIYSRPTVPEAALSDATVKAVALLYNDMERAFSDAIGRAYALESSVETTTRHADDLHDQVVKLTNAVACEQRQHSAELASSVGRCNTAITELQMMLAAIKRSRSWRVTAPLRACGELARRFGSLAAIRPNRR